MKVRSIPGSPYLPLFFLYGPSHLPIFFAEEAIEVLAETDSNTSVVLFGAANRLNALPAIACQLSLLPRTASSVQYENRIH
jgi:hypothetical protein